MLNIIKKRIILLNKRNIKFNNFSLSINHTCSKALNEYSLKNPQIFWSETAKSVSWFKQYDKVSIKFYFYLF